MAWLRAYPRRVSVICGPWRLNNAHPFSGRIGAGVPETAARVNPQTFVRFLGGSDA